jgi:hypothetical protein
VLGGLVAIPILLSGGGGKASRTAVTNGPAVIASPGASLPRLIDRGANYSQASLDALAGQITASARSSIAFGGSRGALALPELASPAPTGPALQDSSAASGALSCVIDGGGPPDGAQAIYLEQAEVSGTPAYIGGFFIPGAKLNIMVIAVTRDGCQPLYSVRQPA